MNQTKCPICGGEVAEKEVEKLLRGGQNTAVVRLHGEVCLRGGERFYSKEPISQFERIQAQLPRRELDQFQPLRQSFPVAL